MDPDPKDQCPYRKGTFGHRHTGKMPCDDEGREGDTLTSQGTSSMPPNDQKLGDRHRIDSPLRTSEETKTANTLILDFQPPELGVGAVLCSGLPPDGS